MPPLVGAMRLAEFIEAERIAPKELAHAIGLACERTLYHWINGARLPSPDFMRAIYVTTGGAVTPNDFYDLPDLSKLIGVAA